MPSYSSLVGLISTGILALIALAGVITVLRNRC